MSSNEPTNVSVKPSQVFSEEAKDRLLNDLLQLQQEGVIQPLPGYGVKRTSLGARQKK